LEADRSMHGTYVTAALDEGDRETRRSAEEHHPWRTGVMGSVVEVWAIPAWRAASLNTSRPPVENESIEILNGRLRDECLNVEWFNSSGEARDGLARWRRHYNPS
jgi:putative transposase